MIDKAQYLINAVTFAKEHFEHTESLEQRCRYVVSDPDEHGNASWARAYFGDVYITILNRNETLVIDIWGNYKFKEYSHQKAEIDIIMMTYESCKPGYPASDIRGNKNIKNDPSSIVTTGLGISQLIPEGPRDQYQFNKGKHMYTYEVTEFKTEDEQGNPIDQFEFTTTWSIFDPDGDELAVVHSETEAEALVSHLNRNN